MQSSSSNKIRVAPADHLPPSKVRRKSSIHQDIHDIAQAIRSDGWSFLSTFLFGISFLCTAVICGALASKAISMNDRSHSSNIAFFFIVGLTAFLTYNCSLRALVMIVTQRGSILPNDQLPNYQLPNDPSPLSPTPSRPPLHNKFRESYGPYPTATKTALYYSIMFIVFSCSTFFGFTRSTSPPSTFVGKTLTMRCSGIPRRSSH